MLHKPRAGIDGQGPWLTAWQARKGAKTNKSRRQDKQGKAPSQTSKGVKTNKERRQDKQEMLQDKQGKAPRQSRKSVKTTNLTRRTGLEE